VTLNGLAIGDINGDGIGDLVSEAGNVAYGLGDGYFTKPISYPIEGALEINNMVLADLRSKGETDIITGGYSAISVLLNLGKGFIEDGTWTNITGGAGCGVAADFNGDGKLGSGCGQCEWRFHSAWHRQILSTFHGWDQHRFARCGMPDHRRSERRRHS
jgi:hypothetical protein